MSTVSIQLTGTGFPQGASRSRKMRPWTTVMHPRGWSLLGMKVMKVMKVKVKRAKAGGPRIGPIGPIPRLQIQEMWQINGADGMRPMRPGLGSKMDGRCLRCLGVLLLSFFWVSFLMGKLKPPQGNSKAWEAGHRKRGVCLVTGASSQSFKEPTSQRPRFWRFGVASCCNLPQMPGLKTLSGIFNLGQRAEGALEDLIGATVQRIPHHSFFGTCKASLRSDQVVQWRSHSQNGTFHLASLHLNHHAQHTYCMTSLNRFSWITNPFYKFLCCRAWTIPQETTMVSLSQKYAP